MRVFLSLLRLCVHHPSTVHSAVGYGAGGSSGVGGGGASGSGCRNYLRSVFGSTRLKLKKTCGATSSPTLSTSSRSFSSSPSSVTAVFTTCFVPAFTKVSPLFARGSSWRNSAAIFKKKRSRSTTRFYSSTSKESTSSYTANGTILLKRRIAADYFALFYCLLSALLINTNTSSSSSVSYSSLLDKKIIWYPIPVGLGIAFLGIFQLYKVNRRERERRKRFV